MTIKISYVTDKVNANRLKMHYVFVLVNNAFIPTQTVIIASRKLTTVAIAICILLEFFLMSEILICKSSNSNNYAIL